MDRDPWLGEMLPSLAPPPDGHAQIIRRSARRRRGRRWILAGSAAATAAIAVLGVAALVLRGSNAAANTTYVGGTPIGAVADPSGFWVLTCARGCAADPPSSSGSVTRIALPGMRRTAPVSVRGNQAIASTASATWVVDSAGNAVRRLDPSTGRTVASIPLALPQPIEGGDSQFVPFSIATTARAVWVSSDRGYVARIDPATNRVVALIGVPAEGTGPLAAGRSDVWLALGDGSILRIDATTNTTSTRPPITTIPGYTSVAPGRLLESGGLLWIVEYASSSAGRSETILAAVNPSTWKVDHVTRLPFTVDSSTQDQTRIWLSNQQRRRVIRIDAASGKIASTTQTPPRSILVASAQGRAWLVSADGTFRRLD